MIYRVTLLIAAVSITVVYFLAPGSGPQFMSPQSAKIIFFHVPPAMLCSAFFIWGGIMGVRFLTSHVLAFDHRSRAAIEVGTLMCFLATVTGSLFAKMQWNAWWEWDPRQRYILAQLLIYAAYFALRNSFAEKERAAVFSAAYAVFAAVTVPFLIWILPRVASFSMHGQANDVVVKGGMDATYRIIFWSSTLVIGLCYAWAYRYRVGKLEETDGLETGGGDPTDTRVVRPVRVHPLGEE